MALHMKGCDTVIHLAGRAHVMNEDHADPLAAFREVNVGLTESLLRHAAGAGVRRFIFVSSIGVNGNHSAGTAFTEARPAAPHDLYAISKWEAELKVMELARATGIDYVIVRPTLIFGADAPGNFAILLKLAATGLPKPFGALVAQRSLLSIWNFVDFLHTCAAHKKPLNRTFLIADNERVTVGEIFTHLGVGMRKKQWLLPVPRTLLALLARLAGRAQLLDKVDSELVVSTAQARADLGWEPPLTTAAGLMRAGKEYAAAGRLSNP
jgi:nucleoside-diphosphate-sugar epimerase